MPRPRLLSIPLLLALLAGAAPAQPPPPDTFAEEMEVREIGLIVEMPGSSSLLRELTLDPGDVLVSVDGTSRPASRLSSEAPSDWTVAVYVDEVLAPAETVFYAALALSRRAERLAGMGTVEIAVADPGPAAEMAPSREPLRISQALTDLSGRARVRRDGAERTLAPDTETLRRQCDRLIAWMSAPRPPGPRVLFLVADGFPVSAEEVQALERGATESSSGRAAILLETARLLASYGWITIPLPLRETREEQAMAPSRPDSDLDRFRVDHQGASEHSSAVPPVIGFHKSPPSKFRWEAAIDLQIQPDLSPLRTLVAATGGKLVGLEALLDPALDNLAGRWQLWFQTPEPNLGQARPLQVRLRNGSTLRTRAWIRSSTPEEVASARVRALLLTAVGRTEGSLRPGGSLPLRVDRRSEDGRLVLDLAVPPFESPGPVSAGPVRVSWAFTDEEGEPQVLHEMAPGIAQPGQGWKRTLTFAIPRGARRVAVAVDDLARERWGGAVLQIP